jgi:long-chain acyl-CoA synthetase
VTTPEPVPAEITWTSRLNELLALDGHEPHMLYAGRWYSWNEIRAIASIVRRRTRVVPEDQAIALICRNHPLLLGAVLGLLAERRCLYPVSALAPADAIRAELAGARPAVLVAMPEDLERAGLRDAAGLDGTTILEVHDGDVTAGGEADAAAPGETADREALAYPAGTAFVLQTSGTTGPPKRVPLSYANLQAALDAMQVRVGHGREPVRLRRSVAILNTQLSHVGGMMSFCLSCVEGRRLALLDKFDPWPWAEFVRDYEVRSAGVPPAALAMLLDSDIPREWLSSLIMIRSGTAPLDPRLAVRFEERFGIPVVQAYGATETQGISSWTLGDLKRWGDAKRGSVGLPHRGVELRVTDPDTGTGLAPGERGRLWVRTAQSSIRTADGWVPTNDIASIDSDGFLWIHGRIDDIINRGGLKVDGVAVAAALETHPWVEAAAVVGIADRRLGEVPGAAVVLAAGAPGDAGLAVDAPGDVGDVDEALRGYLRERLAPYMVPAAFAFVAALPRNATMKVDRGAVRALFAGPAAQPPAETSGTSA